MSGSSPRELTRSVTSHGRPVVWCPLTDWSDDGFERGFAGTTLEDDEARVRTYAGEQAVMSAETEHGKLSERVERQVRRDGADAAWQQFMLGWRSGRDRRVAHELGKLETWRKRGYDEALAGKPLVDGQKAADLIAGPHASTAYTSAWRKGRNRRLRGSSCQP